MAEETTLICAPVTSDHVAGSTRGRCSACAGEIWIAPSGQLLIERSAPVRTVCTECGLAELRSDPTQEVQPIQPNQVREILAHLNRN